MKVLEFLNSIGLFQFNDDIEILDIKECAKGWRVLAYNKENGEKLRFTFEKL